MTRLLKVSRSGYYKRSGQQEKKANGIDPREEFRKELDEKMLKFWNASGQTFGAPRINIDLHDERISVDWKTVAKAMRRLGIERISPRSRVPVTTIPEKPTHCIPDRVKRLFDTGELNRVWMSDITYLCTGEGWLYLRAVRDGCSRHLLGWLMDSTQTTDLVERALRMAKALGVRFLRGLCSTRIGGPSSPGTSSTKCVRCWELTSRWVALACASTTRWPSLSGRRSRPSSTTDGRGRPVIRLDVRSPAGSKTSITAVAGDPRSETNPRSTSRTPTTG